MSVGGVMLAAIGASTAIGAGVFSRAVFAPRSQICGRVLFRGPQPNPPRIALTFDDGPHPDVTAPILDCLRRHSAPAAFFVVGAHAEKHPELVRRIDAEGHLVANHSFGHAAFGTLRRDRYWNDELRLADDAIERIIGKRPLIFRPPMGFKTSHIARAALRRGHTVVTWTRRAFDGVRATPQQIISRLQTLRAGDIILMHDGAVRPFRSSGDAVIKALDHLLDVWRRQGLTFERLDALLGIPGYAAPIACTAALSQEDACATGFPAMCPAMGESASRAPVLANSGIEPAR